MRVDPVFRELGAAGRMVRVRRAASTRLLRSLWYRVVWGQSSFLRIRLIWRGESSLHLLFLPVRLAAVQDHTVFVCPTKRTIVASRSVWPRSRHCCFSRHVSSESRLKELGSSATAQLSPRCRAETPAATAAVEKSLS